ncbi:Asx homology domain-containing protein [Radiomyces spectabilis]|uniref:Asx homology domain-containing protein n=1 Tax=Radiomyces spectabilis TaxID=64574 RepID=UPI00221EF2F0|nr:Asx homology domain-containing protein [Radiomyces spectabilis]KAI8381520.1 Asx homology domain-containing protein [Radiomyces spectabilis]
MYAQEDQVQSSRDDDTVRTDHLLVRSPIERSTSPSENIQHGPCESSAWLLKDASSPLAHVKLESILNFAAFELLSSETKTQLMQLLPYPDKSSGTLSPAFFTRKDNPVFWQAVDIWQQQLASGQRADSNESTRYREPSWKESAYEAYWGELCNREKTTNVAGDSKNITLKDMCSKGLIRENDVMVYKRNFSAYKVVVSKTMKVVKASGSLGVSIQLDNQVFDGFETPTALETKILDEHGRISKDRRPNGNAFKSIRLYRDGKDLGRLFDIRKDGL